MNRSETDMINCRIIFCTHAFVLLLYIFQFHVWEAYQCSGLKISAPKFKDAIYGFFDPPSLEVKRSILRHIKREIGKK